MLTDLYANQITCNIFADISRFHEVMKRWLKYNHAKHHAKPLINENLASKLEKTDKLNDIVAYKRIKEVWG